mgnify:CR=1 FL=1
MVSSVSEIMDPRPYLGCSTSCFGVSGGMFSGNAVFSSGDKEVSCSWDLAYSFGVSNFSEFFFQDHLFQVLKVPGSFFLYLLWHLPDGQDISPEDWKGSDLDLEIPAQFRD